MIEYKQFLGKDYDPKQAMHILWMSPPRAQTSVARSVGGASPGPQHTAGASQMPCQFSPQSRGGAPDDVQDENLQDEITFYKHDDEEPVPPWARPENELSDFDT